MKINQIQLENPMELAQLRDLHRASQIYQHIELDEQAEDDAFYDSVNKSLSESLIAEDTIFLVAGEEMLVGYVQLRVPDKDGIAWIDDLFVDPQYRGKGIAQELLSAGEQELAKYGARKINLYTQLRNTGARAAYVRAGYITTGTDEDYINFEKKL